MPRSRKFAVALAIFVLVFAGAPLALRLLVPPNDFKPLLVKAAHGALGLDLDIEGDLSLSFFPRLAVAAGRTTLKNPPGFPGDLASFQSLRLEVDLGRLLEKRLDVNTLVLASPVVALVRTQGGKTNWETLAASFGAAQSGQSGQTSQTGLSGLEAVSVQALSLRNATLTYEDLQAGQNLKVTNASLVTGQVRLGEPVRLDGGLDFAVADPAVHGRVDFAANVSLTPKGPRVNLGDIAVKTRLFHEALPAGGLELTVTGRADYDAAASRAAWELALAEPGGAILAGKAAASLAPDGPTGEADFTLTGVNPKALAVRFGRPLPATRDPGALTRLEGQLHVSRAPDKTSLQSQRLLLDNANVALELSLAAKGPLALTGRVGFDDLDLDAYAPPAGQAAAKQAKDENPARRDAATPLAGLIAAIGAAGAAGSAGSAGSGQARLDAAVGRLTVSGLRLTDVAATAEVKDGALRIAPASAFLYGGKASAEAKAELKNGVPAVSLRCEAAQIALEPLTRDVLGQPKLSGAAGFSADLTATGQTPKDLLASLSGSAKFNLRQGAIFGVSFSPESLRLPDTLHLAVQNQPQAQTRYDSISASFRIERGQARTSDIAVSAPPHSATGAGTIDLPRERLDLRIVAHPLNLAGVPVKVAGPIEHPDVSMDAAAALAGAVAGVIAAPADAASAVIKAPEKAGKAAVDALGGLGGLLAPKKK
ncbi:MAG: AsmA family protein [Desulfovibrionaceae bacterium]|nr:AsmA family protein [Desulfovibrionaceae bacterium]MBF0513980.1 AsmA family protein [Desulfovibrionaceae bacterium]